MDKIKNHLPGYTGYIPKVKSENHFGATLGAISNSVITKNFDNKISNKYSYNFNIKSYNKNITPKNPSENLKLETPKNYKIDINYEDIKINY